MASLFRVLAAKPYTSSVLRRSFAVLAPKPIYESPDAAPSSSSNDQGATPFETLRGIIDDNTLKAIKHTHMSPVQARIFPLLPDLVLPYNPNTPRSKDDPKDLLVKAKTGTGKTMGFLIPAIEARLKAIDAHVESSAEDAGIKLTAASQAKAIQNYAIQRVGTLIVSPTRELATQIAVEATNLTKNHRGFQTRILLGGESKFRQIREWEGRKDIVVCTPGRILDLLETNPQFSEALKYTQMLILDEADTLLEMGFRDDIESIKSYLPKSPERQTLLFSATVSPAIRQVAISTMSSSYKFINCVSEDDSPVHDHIPQYHTLIADPSQLFPYLLQLITHDQLITGGKSKIIVFFSTTRAVQLFSDFVSEAAPQVLPSGRKTKVYEMHSKRDMDRRMAVSKSFRGDTSGASILITSDVSARGVDYPGVSRVIQMGVPMSGDMYIHRVGRTGRGDNKTGRGDLVLCPWEMGFLKRQLRGVTLKPLIMTELQEETKELASAKDAEITRPGKEPECARRLDEIESVSRAIAHRITEDSAHGVFMSQLGFYLGHIGELGLNRDEVLTGLKNWAQESFGLESPPHIPHSTQMRLGLLSESRGSIRRMNPSRSSSGSPPWMGRGNRSSSSRQWALSGGGRHSDSSSYDDRSGGYGSTSSYNTRDSSKTTFSPRSSSYGSRDSNSSRAPFGSRDAKDSYTPRGFGGSRGSNDSSYTPRASFGSRDSNDSYTPRTPFGSRDSKSYSPGASKYGSRDSRGSSKYGSRGSSSGYSSGASKYGSRSGGGSSSRSSSSSYDYE